MSVTFHISPTYNGHNGSFLGLKWWGSGTGHPLSSGAEDNNEWSYTSTPSMCPHDMLWNDLYLYLLHSTSWTCRKTATGKVSPLHAIKAHRRIAGTDPPILNLSSTWRRMVSFTFRPLNPRSPLRRTPCTYKQCHY
jgi:hypothetical protein